MREPDFCVRKGIKTGAETDMSKTTESKNILLINDLPGYGKVALAAMVPLLSWMGHYTFQLPTALVSNTLDYGKFHIQEMTDYMQETLKVWDELGFDPDCICTGFVVSIKQVNLIRRYLESRSKDKKRLVIVDPIMADGGRLYNGIGPDRVDAMRELVKLADVMLPNMTEAGFLTGIRPGKESGTREEIRELIDGLHQLSGQSVVITSALVTGEDVHLVCGYDQKLGQYFEVPYEYIPARVAGSGDIFSSILTGALLEGLSLKDGTERAVRALIRLIMENQGNWQNYKGILVENYLELLKNTI